MKFLSKLFLLPAFWYALAIVASVSIISSTHYAEYELALKISLALSTQQPVVDYNSKDVYLGK